MSQTKKCVQCDQLISPQRMKDGPGVKTCSRLCFQIWFKERMRVYSRKYYQKKKEKELFRKHNHQCGEKCLPCVRIIGWEEKDETCKKIMKASPGCNFCEKCIQRPEKVKYYEENEWVYIWNE